MRDRLLIGATLPGRRALAIPASAAQRGGRRTVGAIVQLAFSERRRIGGGSAAVAGHVAGGSPGRKLRGFPDASRGARPAPWTPDLPPASRSGATIGEGAA